MGPQLCYLDLRQFYVRTWSPNLFHLHMNILPPNLFHFHTKTLSTNLFHIHMRTLSTNLFHIHMRTLSTNLFHIHIRTLSHNLFHLHMSLNLFHLQTSTLSPNIFHHSPISHENNTCQLSNHTSSVPSVFYIIMNVCHCRNLPSSRIEFNNVLYFPWLCVFIDNAMYTL